MEDEQLPQPAGADDAEHGGGADIVLPAVQRVAQQLRQHLRQRRVQEDAQRVHALQANLYYRYYVGTMVGDKYLCVVVKVLPADAFVLTAYLTDKVKRGVQLWPTSG